jgi:D-3-phosphoglycerate dehydrogenase
MENTTNTVDALILDLLEWVASRERTYAEAMDAWRTSCPRLPVWEEATLRELIAREYANGRATVRVTSSGVALLERHRPAHRDGRAQL